MTQYIFFNCCRVSERLLEQAWAVNAGTLQCGLTFPHVNQAFLTLKRLFIVEHGPCSTAAPTLMLYNVMLAWCGFS